MSDWKAKRFWKQASVAEVEGGFSVLLDGRPVRTPAKALLCLPTRSMAEAIAAEWDAVDAEIDPTVMPVTRSANAAIDKVAKTRAAVIDMLAEYGDSDLLCYRAVQPTELVARQAQLWDPLIDWVQEAYGFRLNVIQGVMHVPQDAAGLALMKRDIESLDDFGLAGFHDLVAISGSLILALAVKSERLAVDDAWSLSRVDEAWQIEQWGEDDEASATESIKRAAFLDAFAFLKMAV